MPRLFLIRETRRRLLPAPSLLCLVICWAGALAPAAEEKPVDYLAEVKPILRERCYACHGALKQESELRLDTAALALRGGVSGAAVEPGDAEASLLIYRVTSDDPGERMPPEGKPLTPQQVKLLRAWIEAGAVAPRDEQPESDPRAHWAFQQPRRPALPGAVVGEPRNPIDALLQAEREERGLRTVPAIDRRLLLRRLYLDLIGLPPSPREQAEFLADTRPNAVGRVVDRLLANPHYGERWGRHWMDVWRYTDWYGLGKQLRYSQKHIWHWRDWIVESVNRDKGYDRMVREMLAADELHPTDHDALRATGFLARNYFLFNRTTWLDNTIEHTSKAFLGLTMNCTKCHDHKYDPISQEDYYRMRAFFEPHQVRLDALPGETDLERDGLPRVFDAHPDEPTYLHVRGDARQADTSRVIPPGVPGVLALEPLEITPVSLPPQAHRPALRPFVLEDHLEAANQSIAEAKRQVEQAERQLAKVRAAEQLAAKQSEVESATEDNLPKDDAASADDRVLWQDDFSGPREDLWETGPGTWKFEEGHLTQSRAVAERAWLRSRAEHPRDFVARAEFRTLGGPKWRSVGVCFDVVGEREKLVYLSAVMPGSKLQIAYRANGQHVYPPNAKQDRPVELGRTYKLEIVVRDKLVNVAIDGQHSLAFELPVQRESGRLQLITFDAKAQWDHFELGPLPADRQLVAATSRQSSVEGPMSVEQAEAALDVARRRLATEQARPRMLSTAHAADVARHESVPSDEIDRLVAAAARATREHELAGAESALAEARLKFLSADDKAREAARKAVEQAQATVEQRRAALESSDTRYTSLRASLKALEGPDETDADRRRPYPEISTGRRTALARWITDRRNPLTARVAANHIWMRHMGQPLVESVTDFGRRAKRPVQHKLLDWLAVELMENDWSMKHLHRLIVTSQAYQLDSSTVEGDAATMERDPNNEYYWRRTPARMESQVLRDSLLALSGRLDRRLGGPTIDPRGDDSAGRRSLYFTHSRDDRHDFLAMFDDADILACYRRSESVVPQQALALSNSKLAISLSRQLADRLMNAHPQADDDQFVTRAFETILCRSPDSEERAACREALDATRRLLRAASHADVERRARHNLIQALLNHNDFITIR